MIKCWFSKNYYIVDATPKILNFGSIFNLLKLDYALVAINSEADLRCGYLFFKKSLCNWIPIGQIFWFTSFFIFTFWSIWYMIISISCDSILALSWFLRGRLIRNLLIASCFRSCVVLWLVNHYKIDKLHWWSFVNLYSITKSVFGRLYDTWNYLIWLVYRMMNSGIYFFKLVVFII